MGTPVLILGFSGTGKSASLRNLSPEAYSLVEVNGKPLPFRSDKKFITTDSPQRICDLLQRAQKDIIVIDDSQYIMANEFMRRAREKSYDKFTEIGVNFWSMINIASQLPAEKTVYFLHHIEVDNYGNMKAKTVGKLLDDKIVIEGMFTVVLRSQKSDGRYFFTTQSDGYDPVKTPIGMFETQEIDNDLAIVDRKIRDFYGLLPAKI